MIYRYLINGVQIDEPQGWDTLITTIKRDRNLKAILTSQDVTLKFGGTGYTTLKTLFDSGFCGEANISIQKSCDGNVYTNTYDGILYTKYFEIDEKRCIISSKVEDNSYYAKIFNNKSLECLPHVGFSKNSTPQSEIVIDVAPVQFVSFFNPTNGVYYPILTGLDKERTCAAYRVFDIFKFLIDFMSDGTVDFGSTLFDTGGDRAGMMFTSGIVIDTVQAGLSTASFESTFNRINYEDFLKEVDRICNVGFYIDTTGSRPKLWIEKYDDLFENSYLITTDKIDELKTTVFNDLLYSKMSIGTSQNLTTWVGGAGVGDFPETIDFLGCKEETFNLLGVCNIDRTLDLTGDYVVSSNIIADGVVNQSDQWDDNFIFIDCTFYSGTTWIAVQSNTLTAEPPYYYNQAFFNDQITLRYLKHVPNSIAFQLGNSDFRFQASKTLVKTGVGATFIDNPVIFQDDFTLPNFDNNGSYNPVTSAFTIPQSGGYTFYVNLQLSFKYTGSHLLFPTLPFFGTLELYEYDSSNVFIQSYVIDNFRYTATNGLPYYFNSLGSRSVVTSATNYFVVYFRVDAGSNVVTSTTSILPDSLFSCTATVTGGGIYQTYNPGDFSVLLHTYKYEITESEFDVIQSNPKGNLLFSRLNQQLRTGWIEQIKMDHKKGTADIILNSSTNVNR